MKLHIDAHPPMLYDRRDAGGVLFWLGLMDGFRFGSRKGGAGARPNYVFWGGEDNWMRSAASPQPSPGNTDPRRIGMDVGIKGAQAMGVKYDEPTMGIIFHARAQK
jgi:hypothetical protein